MSDGSSVSGSSNKDKLLGLQGKQQAPDDSPGIPPWESKPSSAAPASPANSVNAPASASQPAGSPDASYPVPVPVAQPRNGKGVGALVCGLLGLIPFPITGFWLSLVAIIIGWQGYKRAERGEATNSGVALTGFILGIVGLGIQAFVGLGLWLSSG